MHSLLMRIWTSMEKLQYLPAENLAFFRALIKEFYQRKLLKQDDLIFIKKLLDVFDLLMELINEEVVMSSRPSRIVK